jgi:hypothetical protein
MIVVDPASHRTSGALLVRRARGPGGTEHGARGVCRRRPRGGGPDHRARRAAPGAGRRGAVRRAGRPRVAPIRTARHAGSTWASVAFSHGATGRKPSTPCWCAWHTGTPEGGAAQGRRPQCLGRLEEELQALAAAGISCEVVPGVTAALAAAADTQRPLTRRGTGRSVSLGTAMTRSGPAAGGTMPTPRSSTWPAASWPPWAGPCGCRLARRHAGERGLARRLARQPCTATHGWRPGRSQHAACRPAHGGDRRYGCGYSRGVSAPHHKDLAGLTPRKPPQGASRLKSPVLAGWRSPPRVVPSPPTEPVHDSRRSRIVHSLQVHRLCRCLPRRLFPRRPQLPRDRPRRVHRLRGVHPRMPGQRHPARRRRAQRPAAFIKLNADLSRKWPSITKRKPALPDADEWKDVKDKLGQLAR